ncbi:MAG: CAP domain-containing protein [Phormidium sp. GEM2.Bin31]|nr:MAG: CAP domain-containing protein [Phormidium sp. GEM2.Bin31]
MNRQISQLEREVHDQVNAYRRRQGLSPLQFDPYISQLARNHSQRMASGQVEFGHGGSQQRYDAIGQRTPYRQAAENVAWNSGYSNPVEMAVEGWIDSPGHHRNMTGPYERAGVGVAINSEGAYYFTQIFMRPR